MGGGFGGELPPQVAGAAFLRELHAHSAWLLERLCGVRAEVEAELDQLDVEVAALAELQRRLADDEAGLLGAQAAVAAARRARTGWSAA